MTSAEGSPLEVHGASQPRPLLGAEAFGSAVPPPLLNDFNLKAGAHEARTVVHTNNQSVGGSSPLMHRTPTPSMIPARPPLELVQELRDEWSANGRIPRVYEIWQRVGGRSRFRCGGRCVTGPSSVDLKFNVCAWFTMAAPTIFYFLVCSRHLWQNVSPLLPIFTAVLFLISMTLMLLTSCSDPGILPRHALQLVVNGLEEEVAMTIGCQGRLNIRACEPDLALMAELEPKGYRWCRFCHMVQPPRAKHCRDCDNCILRNDHHCPFVNNCIGQRNYGYFCAFLISVAVLGVSVFTGIGIWLGTLGRPASFLSRPVAVVVVGVIGIPTALLFLGVIGLSLFHSVLICQGRTTREVLTGRITGEGGTLFGFRGSSLLHSRQNVQFPMLDP